MKGNQYIIIIFLVLIIATSTLLVILLWSRPVVNDIAIDRETNKYVAPSSTPIQKPEVAKAEILYLVNKERESKGLNKLIINEKLNESAYLKAKDIAKKKYWSHNAPDGTEPWVFFDEVGYSYQHAGENLGRGFDTGYKVVESWLISPTHLEQIMSPNYTETGIAIIEYIDKNDKLTRLFVQHFGAPLVVQNIPTSSPNKIPSRTGEIVPYYDWCNNEEITVYENEIIVKESSDGNVYGMTVDDWECYEEYLQQQD